MDRESANPESAELALVEAVRANSPSAPIVVSVCVTCKTARERNIGRQMCGDARNELAAVYIGTIGKDNGVNETVVRKGLREAFTNGEAIFSGVNRFAHGNGS